MSTQCTHINLLKFTSCIAGQHTEIAKLLILAGALHDCKNKDGMQPIDFALKESKTWKVFRECAEGIKPELEEIVDVLAIPEFSLLVFILFV